MAVLTDVFSEIVRQHPSGATSRMEAHENRWQAVSGREMTCILSGGCHGIATGRKHPSRFACRPGWQCANCKNCLTICSQAHHLSLPGEMMYT